MRNPCRFLKKINLDNVRAMHKLTYLTIEKKFQYEIPKIKGSRFLTYLFPCENKETAENLLQQVKKEHFSATHHCSAWRL
jgi:putative IMPACT (imprinted ancient) family translation regulator